MSENVLEGPDDLAEVATLLLRTGFHAAADSAEGAIVIRLHGELDMATAPGLGRAMDTALDAKPSNLTLELGELTFLDSTGIRVLITACRRAGSQGCAFVLRSPRRPVLKALTLTGVDRLITIEPTPSPG
jgi:anti-sigma B factor antagonist